MGIILRTQKGKPLTHQEVDGNFTSITSSMVYSGSLSGSSLILHSSGSDNSGNKLEVDLSSLGGGSSGSISISNAGTEVHPNVQSINFTGSAIQSVTDDNGTVTVEIVSSGSIQTGSAIDTGAFITSGSFSSDSETILLYSATATHSLDLSSLGGTSSPIAIQNDSTTVTPNVSSINFTGSGVTATSTGTDVTVEIITGLVNTDSFYQSSSVDLNTITFTKGDNSTDTLTIHTGSSGGAAVNIGNSDLTLDATRTLEANGNPLTLNMETADFTIITDPGRRVKFENLNTAIAPSVLGIDGNGRVTTMGTGSISASYVDPTFISASAAASGFGSGGGSAVDTDSFYLSSSAENSTITFTKGDGTFDRVTVASAQSSIVYDIDDKHTEGPGESFETATIVGASSMGATEKTVRIPEIGGMWLGRDVFITATYSFGDTDAPLTVRPNGAPDGLPAQISEDGQIRFKPDGQSNSVNPETYFMYMIVYKIL